MHIGVGLTGSKRAKKGLVGLNNFWKKVLMVAVVSISAVICLTIDELINEYGVLEIADIFK